MRPEYRRNLGYLLLVALMMLAAGMGLRDPWPADEPRFALIARDMADSGDWLFPRVGGVIYPDKPPLFFWLVAAFYKLTGSLRVAFLLPGVLAGIGTVWLVTDLARRLWDPKTAIWCGATLLAIVQFPLQMKSGQIDGLLCLWTTLGLYGFSRHLLMGPDWRWYAIGGIAAGLGVITKGVGFLPYLLFIPFAYGAVRRWPALRLHRDWRWVMAPVLTLLVVAAWLVPMLMAAGDPAAPELAAYRDNILFHQTITRYADPWGHIKPAWYLFTNAAPWLWLPVTLALPWLIPAWRRDIRSGNTPIMLLGAWILLVLIFFSLSDGKRSLYIFPASPALALIAGFHAKDLLARAGVQRLLVALPLVLGSALVTVAMYALMNPHIAEKWAGDVITLVKTATALIAIGLLIVTVVLLTRRRRVLTGFATALVVFWAGAGLFVAPALDATRSGRGLIQNVETRFGSDFEMGFAGWPEQFVLQWNGSLTHFGYRRFDQQAETFDAVQWLRASADRRLLLPEHWLEPCLDGPGVIEVGRAHRRNWVVASRDDLSEACARGDIQAPEIQVAYHRPTRRILRYAASNE